MTRTANLVIMVAVAGLILGIGVVAMPRPPKLSDRVSGDAALITAVRRELGSGTHDRLAVAVIDNGRARSALFGATEDTTFELGSVTKTFTGDLLAIAIKRGEVTVDTKLGELLDVGSGPVADITLGQLATQSSGLPRLPVGLSETSRVVLASLRAGDPYAIDQQTLIDQARHTEVGKKRYLYSNFGFALLGAALASAAGVDYPTLVAQRITGPMALHHTRPATAADRPFGYTASGRRSANWSMAGYAGAVGLRSTLPDMINYVWAEADKSAPGAAATTPIADAGGQRIGYAWTTTGDITWHNGQTGGFSSFIGFDRSHRRAVVVLSNTSVPVDGLAIDLLGEDA
jgi:CubicO group peptidase (beta-lactamase class C family)